MNFSKLEELKRSKQDIQSIKPPVSPIAALLYLFMEIARIVWMLCCCGKRRFDIGWFVPVHVNYNPEKAIPSRRGPSVDIKNLSYSDEYSGRGMHSMICTVAVNVCGHRGYTAVPRMSIDDHAFDSM